MLPVNESKRKLECSEYCTEYCRSWKIKEEREKQEFVKTLECNNYETVQIGSIVYARRDKIWLSIDLSMDQMIEAHVRELESEKEVKVEKKYNHRVVQDGKWIYLPLGICKLRSGEYKHEENKNNREEDKNKVVLFGDRRKEKWQSLSGEMNRHPRLRINRKSEKILVKIPENWGCTREDDLENTYNLFRNLNKHDDNQKKYIHYMDDLVCFGRNKKDYQKNYNALMKKLKGCKLVLPTLDLNKAYYKL